MVLCLWCATAAAVPAQRVVLADPDPELRTAIVASLRPWRIEVVVDPAPVDDDAAAAVRAAGQAARFVVWRDGDQLVVYDRDTQKTERRVARSGKLDAIGAAATALTVKTMLRLPPPPSDELVVAPEGDAGVALRLAVAAGPRAAFGLDADLALRFAIVGLVQPWRDQGWRFGGLADVGGGTSVARAGFTGSWSEWSVVAVASYALPVGAWELAPWAGVGVEHASFAGTLPMARPVDESPLLATVRGGGFAHYRRGAWSIGGMVGLEGALATPTYTRTGPGAQPIFEIPPFGVLAALVVGVDVAP